MTNQSQTARKDRFLAMLDQEHAITRRVLNAFPQEKLDERFHPKLRTARELAWVFVLERMLGIMVFKDEFADNVGSGEAPPPPASWDELLAALEQADRDYRALIEETPEAELETRVRFFTGPKTMGEIRRLDWLWFLLHDEIHHRGQFSIYLRMADGRVPSIYGPSGDEPWM